MKKRFREEHIRTIAFLNYKLHDCASETQQFCTIALLVSIIGGIILVIGFSQNRIYAFIGKGFIKHAAVGFYLVLAGWIAGIIGYLSSK